eukprot:TRINITY_DN20817_c0_g1_i1.p1 TRINITY_DN20817_c0_g1~~TRINITY_DN20817_c0_g1_i1.p1  ORF type:complete len:311 (+),score=70.97 TRINITY_DN20817_c0_g1_i1:81-1013(+)
MGACCKGTAASQPTKNVVDATIANAAEGAAADVAKLVGGGDKANKAKIAEHLLKVVGEGAMKEAVLAAARPGPLDVEKIYDAALEGAMKGAKIFGAKLGAKGVNVAILQASQYAAMVVLSEATKGAGRQTVYYGAGSVTQTALAGCAGMAAAISPMTWAAVVGELSGKAVAWAVDGDEKVAGLIGAVGAGALAGAYVGSSFGPAGTLAGLVGGVAVGTTQHYTGELIMWFLDQAEDLVEEHFLDKDDDDDSSPKEDGTDWRPKALAKLPVSEEGILQVRLPKVPESQAPVLLGGTVTSEVKGNEEAATNV